MYFPKSTKTHADITVSSESNACKTVDENGDEVILSLNHHFLCKYLTTEHYNYENSGTDLINTILQNKEGRGAAARQDRRKLDVLPFLQLCLTYAALDERLHPQRVICMGDSQYQAYQCHTKKPIFTGRNRQTISVNWLLHLANFFRFHLCGSTGEGALQHIYKDLTTHDRPRGWLGKLGHESTLEGTWLGTYSMLCSCSV